MPCNWVRPFASLLSTYHLQHAPCVPVRRSSPLPPQELLDAPNPQSPAQSDAYILFTQQPAEYTRRVRRQAQQYPPPS